jgi:hypothetical protein
MDMVTKKPEVAPTEVTPKAKRRTYSPAFKRKILAEADAAAAEPGKLAALRPRRTRPRGLRAARCLVCVSEKLRWTREPE